MEPAPKEPFEEGELRKILEEPECVQLFARLKNIFPGFSLVENIVREHVVTILKDQRGQQAMSALVGKHDDGGLDKETIRSSLSSFSEILGINTDDIVEPVTSSVLTMVTPTVLPQLFSENSTKLS